MIRSVSGRRGVAALVCLFVASGCGGGGGSVTPPAQVASVVITAPATPAQFATLGRTAQFAAVAKDAAGATLSATITWVSSNTAVATVSGTGLVTAVGNGTATITAGAGGVTSAPGVLVSVQQVGAAFVLSPTSIAFGAISSQRQVTATLQDSGGAPMTLPLVGWSIASGTKTSVTSTGLVTALGVTAGAPDTIRASVSTGGSTVSSNVTATVTQVPVTVTVSATSGGPDTLKTTGRTRQYAAAVKDSNSNAIAAPTVAWSSSTPGTATVSSSTGLATAVADGNTNIVATAGTATGSKALVVRRYAATFSLSPNTSQAITTNAGTLVFTGTAQDSAPTNLTITWTSRNTAVFTLSPASGTSGSTSTATATGNGSAFVVLSGGTRADSASVAVSNQTVTFPAAASVQIGDIFFKSVHNATQNPAMDTVAAGGTVTWTWIGSASHGVLSTGSPSFANSTTKASGTYQVTFATTGTYTYECVVHGISMNGTVVVR
jgi:plastocyanin